MLLELINLLHMIKLEFLHQTSQSKVKGKTQWAIRKTQGFNLVLEKKNYYDYFWIQVLFHLNCRLYKESCFIKINLTFLNSNLSQHIRRTQMHISVLFLDWIYIYPK